MHPGARGDVLGGVADGKAVFDHVFALRDGAQRHFMALGNILGGHNAGELLAFCHRMQGYRHVVGGGDLDEFRHGNAPFL